MSDDVRQAFVKMWKTRGYDKTLLGHEPTATILPADPQHLTDTTLILARGDDAVGTETELPPLADVGSAETVKETSDLEIAGILGQGGMGVVHLARQRSLARNVAVKRIRTDVRNPDAENALVAEARITGGLEHPNIIPVHALGLDAEGGPLLVMKHVHGVEWREMLRHPDHPAWKPIGTDRLRWNIETLCQVCHAVEFAHSKGVIHRDLKTANVMVGEFGEVYVLDWGIAMTVQASTLDATTTGDSEAVQATANETDPVGTPAFMAPEMTGFGRCTTQTDVYLLGAMLHDVLTGVPRHRGTTILEVLINAHASVPFCYGPEIPEELAAVCNRATSREPEDRYDDVRQLRLELRSFLQHSTSIELSDAAQARLEELQRTIQDTPDGSTRSIGRLFNECRFGFGEAQRAWPENPLAGPGLQKCLEVMLRYEIANGNLIVAESLLEEFEVVPDELAQEVERLRESHHVQAARVTKLEAMARSADARVSSRQRGLVVMLFALATAALSLMLSIVFERDDFVFDYAKSVTIATISASILAILSVIFRKPLSRNRFNRQFVATTFAIIAFFVVFRLVAWRLQVPIMLVPVLELVAMTLALVLLTITMDKRVVWPAVMSALSMTAAVTFPGAILTIFPCGMALVLMALGWQWYRAGGGSDPG